MAVGVDRAGLVLTDQTAEIPIVLLVFNPEKVIAAVLVTPVSAAPLLKTASVPAVTGSILLIVMLPASVRFFTAAVASSVWNRPSSLASPSLRLTVRVCPP